jgi:hypothetical protein
LLLGGRTPWAPAPAPDYSAILLFLRINCLAASSLALYAVDEVARATEARRKNPA